MRQLGYNESFLRARLRCLRQSHGLTQRQVAELAGITEIYYQSIEAGRRPNISIRIIGQLGAAFGLTISELFSPDVVTAKLPRKPTPPPHYKK